MQNLLRMIFSKFILQLAGKVDLLEFQKKKK